MSFEIKYSQVSNEHEPIFSRKLGGNNPCFIIAEIGLAHEGSLGTAFAYIDAVAKAGADAVKFQTHIAEAESTPHEKFRVQTFLQDETRFDYWLRTSFSLLEWKQLYDHAVNKGLVFLSTPFSIEAVELLESVGVSAWKIGSGDVTNHQLLKRVAKTGLPVLLSSGMSTWSELDEAVNIFNNTLSPFAIFQCTTSYPCLPENIGLNVLKEISERYDVPVGLSDHSGTIFGSLSAVSLGAKLIEVHAVFSKECFGPDVSSSITIKELTDLVNGVRFIESALGSPVAKDEVAESKRELKELFGRSLVASRNLNIGEVLKWNDISIRKPGRGISGNRINEFVGRKLKKSYKHNEFFEESSFE